MIYGIYAIKDNLSEFLTPTVEYNDFTAKRNFQHLINHSDGVLNANPGDYDLYKIGIYDAKIGKIEALSSLEFIAHGSDVIGNA